MKLSNQIPTELIDQFKRSVVDEMGKMSSAGKAIVMDFLKDPVILRVGFIASIDPEAYQLRLALYDEPKLIEDRAHLVKLSLMEKRPEAIVRLRGLVHELDRSYMVDQRKLCGASEPVSELRAAYSKKVLKMMDQGIRYQDCFPRWWLESTAGDKAIHYNVHLYSKPKNEWEFETLFDLAAVWSIQDAHVNREEPVLFGRGKKQKDILVTVYDADGNNLNYKRKPFSAFTMEKYRPLIEKKAKAYYFEPPEDIRARAYEIVFKALLKYTREKGHLPGYIELAIRHSLSKEYRRRCKKGDMLDVSERETGKATEVEIMRGRTESDSVLVDEILSDLLNGQRVNDPVNSIIMENLGKSLRELAAIVTEQRGKSISPEGIRKRIETHIKPMLRDHLDLRMRMREDQNRTGYAPEKRARDSMK